MRKVIIFLLILLFGLALPAEAQQVSVEAKIDSVAILIGEQVGLTVTVVSPDDKAVVMPKVKEREYLTPGVEVVEVLKDDTTKLKDGMRQISRKMLLTSFDEDAYKLPALTVKVGGEEYQTNPLALKVLTVEVDTLNLDVFFPPKDVQDNPFMWSEWRGLMWSIVILLILCALGWLLWRRFKANKPIRLSFKIVKFVPAHTKALNSIAKIKEERVVSQDDQKAYYTKLTDTLRVYLEERFGFNAMEMTSGEIIAALRKCEDQVMLDELRNLFETADLVKFAKYETLINENDRALVNAIAFIDQTKTEEQEREEKVAPELTEKDKALEHSRLVMKILLGTIAFAAAVAVGLIVYNIVLLV